MSEHHISTLSDLHADRDSNQTETDRLIDYRRQLLRPNPRYAWKSEVKSKCQSRQNRPQEGGSIAMSRPAEQEILEILDAYKDAPMVNPNKVYPPSAAV